MLALAASSFWGRVWKQIEDQLVMAAVPQLSAPLLGIVLRYRHRYDRYDLFNRNRGQLFRRMVALRADAEKGAANWRELADTISWYIVTACCVIEAHAKPLARQNESEHQAGTSARQGGTDTKLKLTDAAICDALREVACCAEILRSRMELRCEAQEGIRFVAEQAL
jgi:signal transduction histidine kinase